MNKKLIRLTESDLHRIVKESVNNTLREISPVPDGSDARRNIGLGGEYRRTVQNLARTLEDSLNKLSSIRNQRTIENSSEMEK